MVPTAMLLPSLKSEFVMPPEVIQNDCSPGLVEMLGLRSL